MVLYAETFNESKRLADRYKDWWEQKLNEFFPDHEMKWVKDGGPEDLAGYDVLIYFPDWTCRLELKTRPFWNSEIRDVLVETDNKHVERNEGRGWLKTSQCDYIAFGYPQRDEWLLYRFEDLREEVLYRMDNGQLDYQSPFGDEVTRCVIVPLEYIEEHKIGGNV